MRNYMPETEIIKYKESGWRNYPSKNLSPAKLASILRELDGGYCKTAMDLFDEMEEKDLHLATVMQTRISAASSLERAVIPANDDASSKKHADFIKDVWQSLKGKTQITHDLLTSIGRGFSVAEMVYEVVDSSLIVKSINFCPQSLFTFSNHLKSGEITEFPLYLPYGEANGKELPRDKFIYHTLRASSGGPLRGGLYRGLSWYFLFTNYSIKDWMSFMDIYGIPLRIGKFKSSADETSRNTLKQAVHSLGSDAAAVISEDTTIEFIESNISGNSSLFQDAVEYFNRQKTLRVLGQSLTTDNSSGGSYSLGKVHERVRQDITRFDCAMLDETLSNDFIIPLIKANFGEQKKYPFFKSKTEAMANNNEKLANLKKLHDMGVPLSLSELYKAAGINEPEKTSELLKVK